MKKIIIMMTLMMVVLAGCTTNGEAKPEPEVRGNEIETIEVETVEVETIETETIGFEDDDIITFDGITASWEYWDELGYNSQTNNW